MIYSSVVAKHILLMPVAFLCCLVKLHTSNYLRNTHTVLNKVCSICSVHLNRTDHVADRTDHVQDMLLFFCQLFELICHLSRSAADHMLPVLQFLFHLHKGCIRNG